MTNPALKLAEVGYISHALINDLKKLNLMLKLADKNIERQHVHA